MSSRALKYLDSKSKQPVSVTKEDLLKPSVYPSNVPRIVYSCSDRSRCKDYKNCGVCPKIYK